MSELFKDTEKVSTYSKSLRKSELMYAAAADAVYLYTGKSFYGYTVDQIQQYSNGARESFSKGEEWFGYRLEL